MLTVNIDNNNAKKDPDICIMNDIIGGNYRHCLNLIAFITRIIEYQNIQFFKQKYKCIFDLLLNWLSKSLTK